MTAQLDPEAKTETAELTMGANREKAVRHGGDAMLAKKIAGGACCARARGQKGLKPAQHPKAKPGTRQKPQRITA